MCQNVLTLEREDKSSFRVWTKKRFIHKKKLLSKLRCFCWFFTFQVFQFLVIRPPTKWIRKVLWLSRGMDEWNHQIFLCCQFSTEIFRNIQHSREMMLNDFQWQNIYGSSSKQKWVRKSKISQHEHQIYRFQSFTFFKCWKYSRYLPFPFHCNGEKWEFTIILIIKNFFLF